MSPQHDWLQNMGPGSEASHQRDAADSIIGPEPQAGEEADGVEKTDGAEQAGGARAGADIDDDEKDDAGSAEPGRSAESGSAESGRSAESGQRTGVTPGEPDHSGWSGRAVGPLSRLLPGGAVELTADEMPAAEPAGSAAGDHEPATAPATDESRADESSTTAQPRGVAEPTEPTEAGLSATDVRWHAVIAGFVDDPRGSVEAARALIDEDVATHIALLARHKEAMHAAWLATSKDADTEALRVTLVNYRDLRKRLADVLTALTAACGA